MRVEIRSAIYTAVSDKFESMNGGAVELMSLQLRKVTIPRLFEAEIQRKLEQQQRVLTAERNMEVKMLEKQIA